jgi:hypothetical protein
MKDPVVGQDNFGSPIYKTLRKHRSMAILDNYTICNHNCDKCFIHWQHKTYPNAECNLYWIWSSCENCLTYNFNASKKDKLKQFTPKQREAVIKWAQKHGVKII